MHRTTEVSDKDSRTQAEASRRTGVATMQRSDLRPAVVLGKDDHRTCPPIFRAAPE